MTTSERPPTVDLNVEKPIWDRFFTVAPLVVVGTREGDGYDLAPKHLAMPLGWENYYAFVCSPRHATYHNARDAGAFTVSFPRPDQVVVAGLTAVPRCEDGPPHRSELASLPTERARVVDGVLLSGSAAFLECELHEVKDGYGPNSLVVGRVVAARVATDALRESDVGDAHHAPLLAYVTPGRYAAIESSHPFPFPANFSR